MSNTVLLIDGSSFIYRAYYAMPKLTSPNGKPTGATRGVVNMLKLMQKKYPTPYWGCVFDAPGKTFREEIHQSYKQTRKATPPDLISQFEDIYTIIRALGIPVIMQSGIEADDIIGTLAKLAKDSGKKVLIATGDKDFTQLVDNDITLINTMNNEILDIAGVINKFGVEPCQMIDYLSIVGDKVDNIPGIDKCGPKTAVKWLTQYKTLDNIINHADKITGVVGENLRASISWLKTAKILVTINTQVQLTKDQHIFDINQLRCKVPDNKTLDEYYNQLGFTTKPDVIPMSITQDKRLILIDSYEQLEVLVDNLIKAEQEIVLLVVADNYPTPSKLKIITIANSENVYTIHNLSDQSNNDLFAKDDNNSNYMPIINRLFASNLTKILPNAKETLQIFAKLSLSLNNIRGDLTLAHYINNSKQKHNLANIFNEYLNIQIVDLPTTNGKLTKDSIWLTDDMNAIINNCYIIAKHVSELEASITKKMSVAEQKLYYEIELPLSKILVEIETAGITLDILKFKDLNDSLNTTLKQLEDKIYQEAKCIFNINSTKQLQDVLFNQLHLPTHLIKKNSNGFSTDEDSLQTLDEQGILIAHYMLEYRTLSKLLNTYVSKLPLLVDNKNKVHTTFDQAYVASGRLSSRNPNLQNIPIKSAWGKKIRQCFIASSGNLLMCADYSQIELRILADLSGDEHLIKAFNQNQDIHNITASEIFNKPIELINRDERRYAKIINFSLIYGKTVFGLAKELKIDRVTAKTYIDTYFAKYPKVKTYLDKIKADAHECGYVETAYGRKIYLPNINSNNRILREAEERLALNAPMQGTSADIIKLAMLNLSKWIDQEQLKSKIILQIHDELILDIVPEEQTIIQDNLSRLMTEVSTLSVKLSVDINTATNWDEAH